MADQRGKHQDNKHFVPKHGIYCIDQSVPHFLCESFTTRQLLHQYISKTIVPPLQSNGLRPESQAETCRREVKKAEKQEA